MRSAADELCIRKTYVTAIEEMDFANIPPRPFGIGFIRSYAEIVGLNSDRIASSYRQSLHENNGDKISEKVSHKSASFPRFKHIFLGLCGLAALFVAWSVLPISEPVEDFQEDAADVVPEPTIVEEENISSEVMSGEETTATIEEIQAEETIETAESIAEDVAVEAAEEKIEQPATEMTSEIEEVATEVEKIEEPIQDEDTASDSEFHKMRMVLSGPSWIEIKQGDKTILRGSVYKKGFSYNIPQEEGLTITVGRPRSVTFYVDDKPTKVVSVMNNKRVSLDSFLKKEN